MMSETGTTREPNGGYRAIQVPGLREARWRKTMTQRQLSAASGVAASTISDLELGRRGAYTKTIKKLKGVLGDDVEDLIEG